MTLDALERLAREAKALAKKATAGPWITQQIGRGPWGIVEDLEPAEYQFDLLEDPKEDDAAFIASSRTLVPSLADAVLRLVAVAKVAETMRESRWLCAPNHDPEGCPGCMMNVALYAFAKSEGGG